MALMGRILGLGRAAGQVGDAVGNVAEVFVGNRAERDAADHERHLRALDQFGAEFTTVSSGRFDRFVNGLNRLPRPLMTLATLGLFCHAMIDPVSFTGRMAGLSQVPDQLWWLLGVIVSFYFGARELHHRRAQQLVPQVAAALVRDQPAPVPVAGPLPQAKDANDAGPAPEDADRLPDRIDPPPARPRQVVPAPGAAPEAPAGHVPQAAPAANALPVPAFDAADPDFNAALEEWRRHAG